MMEWSALIFLTNTLHAAFRGYGLYAAVFLILAITTIFFHTSDKTDPFPFWIDQLAIYSAFLIGLMYFLRIDSPFYKFVAVVSILLILSIFFGGYATSSLCWDSDTNTQNTYHMGIHLIGSVGHHCIMAGLVPV